MLPIKRIDCIEIDHVKGIEKASFSSLDIIPNKPTILVAPNGFGKSSIATAFAAINANRIDLQKDHHHKGDESKLPRIAIRFTLNDNSNEAKEATPTSNEIFPIFDVFVINNQLVSKAKKLKISGATIVTSSIEVNRLVLISKIPDKATFQYKHNDAKQTFGKNGKVLPNIGTILQNKSLVCTLAESVDFSKQKQVTVTSAITAFRDAINGQEGNASQILAAAILSSAVAAVESVQHLSALVKILKQANVSYDTDALYYLAALQISDIYAADKAAFKKVVEYYHYEQAKTAYKELFGALRGTWKNIRPQEDKKAGFVLDFPKANQISNGERDIICFVAMLKQARLKFKREHCILIIDEIFDYLDDANLVACQYYLTQLIDEMKGDGRQIFPIILTHLSPGYFKNYYFSDQKVRYLDKIPSAAKDVERVIVKREDPSIREEIARCFLHFTPDKIDLGPQFHALGLASELATSSRFTDYVRGQLMEYIAGKNYDPVAVCCAVRLNIEEKTFERLAYPAQAQYLEIHKTVDKLTYAAENGVAVPETFYILGVIYNQAMHLRENQDNVTPLRSKLENLTIKSIIRSSVMP